MCIGMKNMGDIEGPSHDIWRLLEALLAMKVGTGLQALE